jgi:hypothetical protein
MNNGSTPPRELPHSLEAEEYLLSCCFLDGNDVVGRCLARHIGPESFYNPKHGILFERMRDLYHRQESIDIGVVTEELKANHQLELIGGYPFLVQVTSRIPTTAQANYFIQRVFEHAALREMIKQLSRGIEVCYNFSGIEGDIVETIEGLRSRLDRIQFGPDEHSEVRNFQSFPLPDENDANALFGRNRYVCRGDGVLVVGSSGMGKSVFNYEWAALAAVGRPFLGITTKKPLKSLIIQAEDSDGDVGEILFSINLANQFTDQEQAQIKENVLFIHEKVARGDAFIAKLRQWCEKLKPDLIWINPLHAYAGCDITDATLMGHFLRGGLNVVNRYDLFAFIVVHHTPKPITGKGVPDKKWHEFMYDAAGSAELVNWARAVITIKPTEAEGKFNIVLAKRGKRAGVMISKPGEGDGITRLELTLKIPVQHSTKTVMLTGRKHPFHLMHWETRAPDADVEPNAAESPGRFSELYSDRLLIVYYPASTAEALSLSAVQRQASEHEGIGRTTFYRRHHQLMTAELIVADAEHRLRRTAKGDAIAASS